MYFLINDNRNVQTNFNSKRNILRSSNFLLYFQNRMQPLNNENNLVTIKLKYENQESSAQIHEYIADKKKLAKISDYFRSMFNSGFVESNSKSVEISGVTPTAMNVIIDWMENDGNQKIRDLIERDSNCDICEVLQATSMLLISDLEKEITKQLIENFNIDNVCDYLMTSELYSNESLFSDALTFILWHFDQIWKSEGFLNLPFHLVKVILEHKHLNVQKSEMQAFQALSAWINHDKTQRSKYLQELVECVIVERLSLQERLDIEKSLKEDEVCLSKSERKRILPHVSFMLNQIQVIK